MLYLVFMTDEGTIRRSIAALYNVPLTRLPSVALDHAKVASALLSVITLQPDGSLFAKAKCRTDSPINLFRKGQTSADTQ